MVFPLMDKNIFFHPLTKTNDFCNGTFTTTLWAYKDIYFVYLYFSFFYRTYILYF